ncbi:MAG: DUF2971 domain-containing protein [Bacteroidaceae bacterium]|nr:DUF2971 domain-containing protein [Bacteroidaceae bacterium]
MMEQIVTQQMVNELDEYVVNYYYLIFTLRYLQENPATDNNNRKIDMYVDFSNAINYIGIKENITPDSIIEKVIYNFNKNWSYVLDFPDNKTSHYLTFEEKHRGSRQIHVLRLNNLTGITGNFGALTKIKLIYGCALDIFSYAVSFSKSKDFFKVLEDLILEFDQKLRIEENTNFQIKSPYITPVTNSNIFEIKSNLFRSLINSNLYNKNDNDYKKRHLYYMFKANENYKLPKVAYQYRTCNKYLYQALLNEKLNLSSPSTFNDPFDCPIRKFIDNKSTNIDKSLKITCFVSNIKLPYSRIIGSPRIYEPIYLETIDNEKKQENAKEEYLNTLMWAHYADLHKGICIKYKFTKSIFKNNTVDKFLYFDDVSYSDKEFESINNDNYNYQNGVFLKSEAWKYENELRLLYYDVNGKGDYVAIDAPYCIEAIYFGVKCSKEDKETIYKIMKDRKYITDNQNGIPTKENVHFYEIKEDEYNFGQLKAVDYNPD